jgi:hypothetical protein
VWAPDAKQLWQRIKNDEPLGRFGADSLSADDPVGTTKPQNSGDQQRQDAGLCS